MSFAPTKKANLSSSRRQSRSSSRRLSRYTRPNPIPMRLMQRDEQIITRCFEDKLLSSSDLLKLFFNTRQRLNKRLQKLYSQHYLDRHYLPTIRPHHGSSDALYSLGKKGVQVVALHKEITTEQVYRARRKLARQLKSYSVLFTLAHIKAVSQIRIAFQTAFENCQEAEILGWIPERLLEQRFKADDKRMKLRPDGFMQYKTQDKIYNAFIEIDMGTQSTKQIQDKIRRYLAFSQTDLPQSRFGSKWFRVLFITKTQRRSSSRRQSRSLQLKKAIAALVDKMFWITDVDKLTGNWLLEPVFWRVGLSGMYPLL